SSSSSPEFDFLETLQPGVKSAGLFRALIRPESGQSAHHVAHRCEHGRAKVRTRSNHGANTVAPGCADCAGTKPILSERSEASSSRFAIRMTLQMEPPPSSAGCLAGAASPPRRDAGLHLRFFANLRRLRVFAFPLSVP